MRYLIITNQAIADAFQPLADWKNHTGIPAEIRTLEWIKANTNPGVDDAETIRNFIKWAYKKWGTQYVLIGGDPDIIPTRFVFANNLTVSTDLYYSDLDGNWNGDGDNKFGELEDGLDYYPEIFISRAPVKNYNEAVNFVNKTLRYIKATDFSQNFGKNLLLIGANLWENGDGAELCNFVSDSVPYYVNKVLLAEGQMPGTSSQEVINYLNQGYNFIYSVSHGDFNLIKTEKSTGQSLYSYDIDHLFNNELSIWLLSSCFPNQIEQNCFSEHFINKENYGGVGYIGSTSVDYPEGFRFYHRQLLKNIYNNTINELSPANLLSKTAHIIYHSYFDWWERQLYFSYLTLGDPQLTIWTDDIVEMSVSLSDDILIGKNNLTVTVRTVEGNQPVNDATVCLYKEDDVWETAKTINGEAIFDFEVHTAGNIFVTVTKTNHKPVELKQKVLNNKWAHLHLSYKKISGDNNENDRVESGETVKFGLFVENNGGDMAEDIHIMITSNDDYINILNGEFELDKLKESESLWLEGDLEFEVANNIPLDTLAHFTIQFIYNDGNTDTEDFIIPLYAPRIIVTENSFVSSGNRLYELSLQICNNGKGTSTNLVAHLISNDTLVNNITQDVIYYDVLEPSQKAWGNSSFQVEVDPVHFQSIDFELHIKDNYQRQWIIPLTIFLDELPSPTGLSFLPESPVSLSLQWEYSTASQYMRYNIFRAPEGEEEFQMINSLPVEGNCYYLDTGLKTGELYQYKVQAVDSSGNVSAYSDVLIAWGSVSEQSVFPVFSGEYAIGTLGDAVPYDFKNDGKMEIVAPGNNGRLYVYSNQGDVLYEFNNLEGNLLTPAFGNVDGDKAEEMVVPSYVKGNNGNKIYIFDCNGLNLEYILSEPDMFSLNHVVLADADKDGIMEIFTTAFGGNYPDEPFKNQSKLFSWHYNQETVDFELIQVTFEDTPYLLNTPSASDINFDGIPEIVLGFPDGKVKVFSSLDLSEIISYDNGTEYFIGCQISLGDIDCDGKYDLVFTIRNKNDDNKRYLKVLEYDYDENQLNPVWEYMIPNIINYYGFTPSPTLAQLNGDDKLEIVIPVSEKIYLFNSDGSLLSNWPVDWNSGKDESIPKAGISHAIVGDMDGDGSYDIIVASSQGLLYAFDVESGKWLKGFPMKIGRSHDTSPALSDLDNDGDIEVVFQEGSGWLHVCDIPDSCKFLNLEWPMRFANYQHTGAYSPATGNKILTGNNNISGERTLKRFALLPNYPNPFNPTTEIAFELPERVKVTLEIYNLNGQLIKRLLDDEEKNPGLNQVYWNATNTNGTQVSSGIYFYKIKAGTYTAVRKMLLIK